MSAVGGGSNTSAAAAAADAAAPPHDHDSPQVDQNVKECSFCKKPGARKKCDGCRQRRYCDKKCQKNDWGKQHKDQCKKQKLQPPLVDPNAKECSFCRKPGARKKCTECRHRRYCDKKCQKKDWKKQHKDQCKKLQQVFVPPPPPPRGTELEAQAAGGSGGAAAAGAAGAETSGSGNEEPEFLCPICLDNADDATVDGRTPSICTACGQMYCGACSRGSPEKCKCSRPFCTDCLYVEGGLADQSPNCPTCRAPIHISVEDTFEQLLQLVNGRPVEFSYQRESACSTTLLGCFAHLLMPFEQGNATTHQ